jgi:hypothetical protein
MQDKLSFKQALWRIFLSTLLISGSSFTAFFVYKSIKKEHLQESQYNITTLVQTGPQMEALKSLYLAELLELSHDRPVNIFAFDTKEGEKRLLSSPLIKEAKIKKYEPGTLHIDYTIRQPVAWLADYENTAIDSDGYIFPVYPFLSPKELPEIFVGLPPFHEKDMSGRLGGRWQKALSDQETLLALEILQLLKGEELRNFRIVRIDTSNAFVSSLGKKCITLEIENEILSRKGEKETIYIFPAFLRLSVKNFRQELGNFLVLNQKMMKDYRDQVERKDFALGIVRFKHKILDFRIPGVAYIGGGN